MRVGVLLPSGGMRCFYQLGVLEALRGRIRPQLFAGVSGGALASVTYLAHASEALIEAARRVAREGRARWQPRRLLEARSPLVHGEVLEAELRRVLTRERLEAVAASGVALHIMAAALPGRRPYPLVGAPVMMAHALEIGPLRKLWFHPRVGEAMGFRPHWFEVAADTAPDELVEMLLATSCFPPLTRPIRHGTTRLFDGAFASSMPAIERFHGRHDTVDELWVIHTRRDQRGMFADRAGVRHISPSAPLRVGIWDYGNEAGMVRAWEIGWRDGQELAQELEPSPPRVVAGAAP